MLNILKAALLGFIEGVTEWLPISSTGHLILANEFIHLDASDAFLEMFDVVIQLGAILAVVVLFWNRLWPFCWRRDQHGLDRFCKHDVWQMWFKVLVACIPTVVIGGLLEDRFHALFYAPVPVAVALIAVGVLFLVVETWNKGRRPRVKSIGRMSWGMAIVIGLWQTLAALFPGTSRSGATIVGALLLGISRTTAAEFTFFLAVPVMFGASLLKLVKFGFAFSGMELAVLLTGMLVAFAVSLLVIRFLMNYIKKHDFKPFGWYRIALGIVVLVYFLVLK